MSDPNIIPDRLGDELYYSVLPLGWADPQNDYALKTLCYGFAKMFKQAELYGRTRQDAFEYVNLIEYPSFETGLSPWDNSLSVNSVATAESGLDAPSGTQVAKLVKTVASGTTMSLRLSTTDTPEFDSGQTYTFSASCKIPNDTAQSARLRVIWLDFAGTTLSSPSVSQAQTGNWQRLSLTTTAPADAEQMIIFIDLTKATTLPVGALMYVDAVSMVDGSTTPPYFDGDTQDAYWFGTPHNSASKVSVLNPDGPNHPGWSIIFDVDHAPADALPYLAQYVGERIPTGTNELDARDIVRSKQNQQRGTPAAIIAAAKSQMVGKRTISLTERADGDAYKMRMIASAFDTPYSDQTLTNFVTNPSAEVNTTGWQAGTNTTLARVTTQAQFGSAAFSATNSSGSTNTVYFNNNVDGSRWLVTASRPYTFSVWVKTTVSREVRLFTFHAQPGGGGLGSGVSTGITISNIFPTPGVWTKLEVTSYAPVGYPWASVELEFIGTLPGEVHYADGFMLYDRPMSSYFVGSNAVKIGKQKAPDYFDGSMPGSSWTGTAHASTSVRAPITTLVKDAIKAVKPAGIVLDLVQAVSTTYDQLSGQYNSLSGTYDAL